MKPLPLLPAVRAAARLAALGVALALSLSSFGCTPGDDDDDDTTPINPRALVLGIDGMRPDAMTAASTPNIDQLMADGAWSLEASTQLQAPTMSGPGWTSILTGVDAQKHNIYGNGGWDGIDRRFPTFLARAHEAGFATATAAHWLPVHSEITEADVVDTFVAGDDAGVADAMEQLLADGEHAVHFVHLDDVDHAGHDCCFEPDDADYLAAIEVIDGQVGQILSGLDRRAGVEDESWLVVLTTDHGGSGSGHGALGPEFRTIPFVMRRDGGPTGELGAGVSHLDVHPTVMEHLGVEIEASWLLDGVSRAN